MKFLYRAIYGILLVLHLGLFQEAHATADATNAQQLPEGLGVPVEEVAATLTRIETSQPYRFEIYGKALDLLPERDPAKKVRLVEFLITGFRFEFGHRIIEELTSPHLHAADFSEKARSEIIQSYKSTHYPYLFLKLAGVLELPTKEVEKWPRPPDNTNTLTSIFGNSQEAISNSKEATYYDRAYFLSYEWGMLLYRARMANADAAKTIIIKLKQIGAPVLIDPQVIRDLAYTQNPLLIQYLEEIALHNKTPTEYHDDFIITAPSELAAEALKTWKDYHNNPTKTPVNQ